MSEYEVKMLKLSEVFADPTFNCRGLIAPVDVMDLARDIKKHGLITPITVESFDGKEGKKYRVIAGHRRHKAFRINEETEIPAFIRNGLSEIDARVLNLNENIARKELTLYQEALAIKALFDLKMTEAQVCKALGAARGWVQIRFMVLKLPIEIQEEVKAGNVSQQTIRDSYSVIVNGGTEAEAFEVVKLYKEAKERGVKIVARNQKVRTSPKRQRTAPEIFKLQDMVRKMFGNGLTTKCLAWCGGSINNEDMQQCLEEYSAKHDVDIPSDNFLIG